MVMREHHRVQRRQVMERKQRGKPTLGAREVGRPDPLAPHRIGKEAVPVDLEQHCRVPNQVTRKPERGSTMKRSGSTGVVLGAVLGERWDPAWSW